MDTLRLLSEATGGLLPSEYVFELIITVAGTWATFFFKAFMGSIREAIKELKEDHDKLVTTNERLASQQQEMAIDIAKIKVKLQIDE
jgi:hypothetical protein